MTRTSSLLALVAAAAFCGCAAFSVPEEPPKPTPLNPVWSADELQDHLEFMNDPANSGRATGTQGYARSAAYVAARLSEFRLQPALGSDFRVVYEAPINHPISASMRAVGAMDSLILLPGIDFIPDGRSDSGRVNVSRLVLFPEGSDGVPTPPFGVVTSVATRQELEAWRDAGATLVIQVGDLSPTLAANPIRNLIVVRTTPMAVSRLIGSSDSISDLTSRAGQTVEPSRRVLARVSTNFQPQAGAINILGYLSGKHPVHARDLVVVCSDMDGFGAFAGIPVTDFRNFGVSTAALLEVARNLAYVSRRWGYPERSVMVAVWSGAQLGYGGLRYYLANPTWRIDKIAAFVYVGLSEEGEEEVRKLLEPHGIPLYAVRPHPEALHAGEIILQPDPALRRLARDYPATEPLDLDAIIKRASEQAVQAADETYRRLMVETTAHDPEPSYRFDND